MAKYLFGVLFAICISFRVYPAPIVQVEPGTSPIAVSATVTTSVSTSTGSTVQAATGAYSAVTTMNLSQSKSGIMVFSLASGTTPGTYRVDKYVVLAGTAVTGTETSVATGAVVSVSSDTVVYPFYVLNVIGATNDKATTTFNVATRKE